MQYPIPITEIFFVPETGCYGYCYRFDGRPIHYTLDTGLTVQAALSCCDAHHERVWEDASDADENRIMISRAYKPGSVLDRCSRSQ